MAVARNRPFNSCKIEDNEAPSVPISICLACLAFSLSFSFSFFTLALFLSHSCLPVEPNPAPRSRVQRRSLQRSVINHRRVGLTRLHAREPARARRELLSSSFFFFLLFTFRYTKAKKKRMARKSDEKLRKKMFNHRFEIFLLIISIVYFLCVFSSAFITVVTFHICLRTQNTIILLYYFFVSDNLCLLLHVTFSK